VDRKLRMAFGASCRELNHTFKIEQRKRGLVLAFEKYSVEDGRLKLTPLSVALFKEEQNGPKFPEIHTVRCQVAFLRFDKPIDKTNVFNDLQDRKIAGAELRGDITIITNRGTPQFHDDIEIIIKSNPGLFQDRQGHAKSGAKGPAAPPPEAVLFYDEKLNKIWTDGWVKLLDKKTQPHPTMITGIGMDLFLSKEVGPGKPAPRPKQRGDNPSGVDLIVLRSGVEMDLYPESNSGFPSVGRLESGRPEEARPQAKSGTAQNKKGPQPSRSKVIVKTPGSFTFDVNKDLAVFESPQKRTGLFPEQIEVIRQPLAARGKPEGELFDSLICDRLKLQFRRKAGAAETGRDGRTTDREIESAHATARTGNEVVLALDTETLSAYCSELIYHCPTPTRGTQTILRGSPLQAIKDAHKIKAQELILVGEHQKGSGQQVVAKGPGQVDLYDRNNPKNPYSHHALWKDTLITTKAREADRIYDLLTLTGDAAFLDDEHEQELHGQRLQVWLEPGPSYADAQAAKQQSSAAGARQRPHKVEAFEQVRVRSPELLVHSCKHLIVRFEDALDSLPKLTAAPLAAGHMVERPVNPSGPDSPSGAVPKSAAPGEKAPKKPMELWARDVAAYVVRREDKNELRELVTDGSVHVHQDGNTPQDKGVDIKGEMLHLKHQAAGDVLVVFGDKTTPAQLQLGELFLLGPQVTIDQEKNIARVNGVGAMTLPSKTTFEGGKPSKPGTRLEIHWTNKMFFDGRDADFYGGVAAYQDGARMKCESLQVTLDRTVSFKEGQKGSKSAEVEKLVSHGQVYIEDSSQDESGRPRYQRLRAHQVESDNKEGPVFCIGPGTLLFLQYGAADLGPGTPPPPPKGGKDPRQPREQQEVLKLTRVDFEERLWSHQRGNPARSIFRGNVQVVHLPADNPDVPVDIDDLPRGGMYLRCDVLTIFSLPAPAGKKTQVMIAESQAYFRAQDFFGRAHVVKYDEASDTVIFQGSPGNPATLYKVEKHGDQPKTIRGTRILYNRKAGTFSLDGGTIINWSRLATPPGGQPWGEESLAVARLHADGQDKAFARLAPLQRRHAEQHG
jgi:hypothetical protein